MIQKIPSTQTEYFSQTQLEENSEARSDCNNDNIETNILMSSPKTSRITPNTFDMKVPIVWVALVVILVFLIGIFATLIALKLDKRRRDEI